MQNYSLAKLELLALKWAICDTFREYLIGSKFTVFTDNNPLTYICTCYLGATQIHWLSDLMLFDFGLKYQAGKSNQAADTLSRHPVNPDYSSESSDNDGRMGNHYLWNCLPDSQLSFGIRKITPPSES